MQRNISARDRLIYKKKMDREWDQPGRLEWYIMKLIAVIRGILSGKQQNIEDAIIVFDQVERKRLKDKSNRRRARKDKKALKHRPLVTNPNELGAPYQRTPEVEAAFRRARLGMVLCKDGVERKKEEVYPKGRFKQRNKQVNGRK